MNVRRFAVAAATLCGLCMVRDARAEASLGEMTVRLTVARAGLHGHELSGDDVVAAEQARDALSSAVEEAKPRMDKDPDLASGVQVAMDLLKDVDEDIRLAHLIADFVAGPGAASKKGMALSQKASAERDAHKRQATLREAQGAFQACAADSQKMMTVSPVLNRTALFLATSRTSPKKIATVCAEQERAIAREIAAR